MFVEGGFPLKGKCLKETKGLLSCKEAVSAKRWDFFLPFCKAIKKLKLMVAKSLRSSLKICGATHIFLTLLQIPLYLQT